MIKIAFFDIDGTLVSFKTHAMPASTVRALDILRGRGVRLVVASGRSPEQIPSELQTGFDACIANNGQRCLCDGELYRNVTIDQGDVRAIVDQVEHGLYDAGVVTDGYTFVSRLSPRVLEASRTMNITYVQDDIRVALERSVYQFLLFADPADDHLLLDATSSVVATRWTDLFADVAPAEGGKDYGVRATLERFGLSAEDAIAFGDGENDLSMLSAVGTGVAMGNASDAVKAQAAYVTDDVDEDGIWNACLHFGLV